MQAVGSGGGGHHTKGADIPKYTLTALECFSPGHPGHLALALAPALPVTVAPMTLALAPVLAPAPALPVTVAPALAPALAPVPSLPVAWHSVEGKSGPVRVAVYHKMGNALGLMAADLLPTRI